MLSRLKPDINKFKSNIKSYNNIKLKADFIAGISVAAISLPQNMAYALIVGVEPIYGIYATIVSMFVFTFVGQSNYLIVGPTNIMAMALASSLSGVVQGNYLQALLLLTFLVGVCQLLFGLLKFGKLVNYVSHSLIVGLSTGAILMIGVGQLQTFMGISIDGGINLFTGLYAVARNLVNINWLSVLIGFITIIVIIIIRRINTRLPSYLISIIVVTIIVYLFRLDESIAVVGNLPSGIMDFNFINFDMGLINTLFSKGLSIAFLGLIQTLAVLKSLAMQTKEEVDINSEFIGQGIINMTAPFFSGFATAGSFTNSFTNVQSGAVTKLAQFVSSLIFILVLILMKSVLAYVPIAALSGLIMVVTVGSLNIEEIKKNIRTTQGDAIIFLITFLSTISLPGIDNAVYIGLIASVVIVLKKSENVNMGVISYTTEEGKLIQREVSDLGEIGDEFMKEKCIVLNLRGNLHFSSVNNLKNKFETVFKHGDNFVIRLREIDRIDTTIMREMENFISKVHEADGKVFLSGVDKAQYERLKRYGIVKMVNQENVYISKDKLFSATEEAYSFMEEKEFE